MKTIIVWYLISLGGYNSNQVVYSPAMATKEDCIFMREEILKMPSVLDYRLRCVGVKINVKE
jgi:hypothetical protein